MWQVHEEFYFNVLQYSFMKQITIQRHLCCCCNVQLIFCASVLEVYLQ